MDPFARACKQAARQIRRVPAELRKELKRHVTDRVAQPLAERINANASSAGPYGPRVAGWAKGRLDTEPTIVIRWAPEANVRGGARVGELMFGQEWGGGGRIRRVERTTPSGGSVVYRRDVTAQFAHTRAFVYPTMRRNVAGVLDEWVAVLDPFLDLWEGVAD